MVFRRIQETTVKASAFQMSRMVDEMHLHLKIGGEWVRSVLVLPIGPTPCTAILSAQDVRDGLKAREKGKEPRP